MDAEITSKFRRKRAFPGYTAGHLRLLAERSDLTPETRAAIRAEIEAREIETSGRKVAEYEVYSREGDSVTHVGSIQSCLTHLAEIAGDAPLHEVLAAGWEVRAHG